MGYVSLRDINFISLQSAVFCTQCELISENCTATCLACGSQALLNLSRVLGGSLLGQQNAHLLSDFELDRLVRELLLTVPEPKVENENQRISAAFAAQAPSRHHARAMQVRTTFMPAEFELASVRIEPAVHVIAERALALTRATGAAIALRSGNEIVCRARTGRTAPDIGVRLQTDSGISAQCVRTGEVVLCNDAENSPEVDVASCRHLGVRSVLAAPLRHFRSTLGIFEVLSSTPYAFDRRDVATMQLLSSMMVAAISRLSSLRHKRATIEPEPQALEMGIRAG
jgi:GAF domain-containing protein